MNLATLNQTGALTRLPPWHMDRNQVALVKRTAAKDCNEDEFNQFVSVCRDLNLSPLRKQVYAFVFQKGDPERRNMSIVVGIDGGRAIAARSGNYRPDNQEPQWTFKDDLKNPMTNPHGIEKCTVGVFHRPTKDDPFERIVHTVYWEEYAPIVKTADSDAYEWVGTGEYYPDGHAKAGREKQRKQLRPGANSNVAERLDPNKQQWIKSGRNQIAKCAEMGALRKGWPEDLSRVVVEEETHRSAVIEDVDYEDLTPSAMVVAADTGARIEKLGGPALLAALGENGALVRVAHGRFADEMLAATEGMAAADVTTLVDRNRAALQEFWAHNKTDALALKKELEKRAGAA